MLSCACFRPHSVAILGRSLVIHDSQGNRWVCADIIETPPAGSVVAFPVPAPAPPVLAAVQASAVFDGTSTAGVYGRIDFYQATPTSRTVITIQIMGILGSDDRGFGQMHVHERRRVDADPNGACSASAVGGHFNPTSQTGPCTPIDLARCEIGDISGKHGALTGSSLAVQYQDDNLPLSGPN